MPEEALAAPLETSLAFGKRKIGGVTRVHVMGQSVGKITRAAFPIFTVLGRLVYRSSAALSLGETTSFVFERPRFMPRALCSRNPGNEKLVHRTLGTEHWGLCNSH
jgi:hypothetical protein